MNELKTDFTVFYKDGTHAVYHFDDGNYDKLLKMRFDAENNPDIVYISDVTTVEIIKEFL